MKFPGNLLIIAAIAAILLVAGGLVLFLWSIDSSKETAAGKIKEAYSSLGVPVDILSVKEESGILRLVIRQQNATEVQDVFLTRDGNLLIRGVERLQDYTSRILREDNFSMCLASRNVVVFGAANDVNTLQQLQLLGGFSARIFFDCGKSLQECLNYNVTSVPATLYQGKLYPGVQPAGFYTQLTGCA